MGEWIKDVVFDGWEFGIRFAQLRGMEELAWQWGGQLVAQSSQGLSGYWRFHRSTIDARGDDLIAAVAMLAGEEVSTDSDAFAAYQREFAGRLDAARGLVDPKLFLDVQVILYTLNETDTAIQIRGYHPGLIKILEDLDAQFIATHQIWRICSASTAMIEFVLLREFAKALNLVVACGRYGLNERRGLVQLTRDVHDSGFLFPYRPVHGTSMIWPKRMVRDSLITLAKGLVQVLPQHQQEGVVQLVREGGGLIADDVGLGGMEQVIVAASILAEGKDVLLVTRSETRAAQWRYLLTEAESLDFLIQSGGVEGGWQILIVEDNGMPMPLNDQNRYGVLVVDVGRRLYKVSEAYAQGLAILSAQSTYRMVVGDLNRLRQETEFYGWLKVLGHPAASMRMDAFRQLFQDDSGFRDAVDCWLRPRSLARRKEEVFQSLRGKQRLLLPLFMTGEQRDQYDRVLANPVVDPNSRIQILRQMLEHQKISAVVEAIFELRPEDKFIVYCLFGSTVDLIKQKLSKACVSVVCSISLEDQGSQAQSARAVSRFQGEPGVRGLIAVMSSLGDVGLTAAGHVFFMSLPVTAENFQRLEGLFSSGYSQRPIMVNIPAVHGSVDEDLWQQVVG